MLGELHLRLLAAGFVADPAPDRTLPMILRILDGFPDAAFDRAAVAAVEGLMEEKELPWWAGEAVDLVIHRFEKTGFRPSLALSTANDFGENQERVRKRWEGAKRRLKLPSIAPARPRRPRVPGVGDGTPS